MHVLCMHNIRNWALEQREMRFISSVDFELSGCASGNSYKKLEYLQHLGLDEEGIWDTMEVTEVIPSSSSGQEV